MNKIKNLFLLILCHLSASAQRVTSVDIVRVSAIYEKEAQYFYKENWEAFRQEALRKKLISGYNLIRTTTDSSRHFNYILLTEYADSTSFRKMEENFRPIMKSISPNGPKMLNEVPRKSFLTYVSGYEGYGEGAIQQSSFKTHYRIFGKGKPLVIINGGPGMNSNGFANVAQQIADLGYQAIIYDQRGTGRSALDTVTNSTVTMDLMAEDVENLRKTLKINTWTVMGHSFGGLLASHYFAKYGESVEKLIFSSSGGVNLKFMSYVGDRLNNNLTEMQRDSMSFYQKKMSEGDTTWQTRIKRATFLANAYVVNKSHVSIIGQRLSEINFKLNGLVFEDLQKIKFDYTNRFIQSQTPVLVIQGTNDIISIETAKEIQQSFGNVTLHILKNCAHYGWLDNPEEYFSVIDRFLSK